MDSSTLRGGFGAFFRRVVCAFYSYVFETPPPDDTRMMRKYEAAPHPSVIEPPSRKTDISRLGPTGIPWPHGFSADFNISRASPFPLPSQK